MIFKNGKDIPLNSNAGSMPNVSIALRSWFQPMTFTTIVKTVEAFQDVETPTDVIFQGVLQPFSAQKLMQKPEGQRQWKWYTVHAEINLILVPDEVITYLGNQFRVMEKFDWTLDGYIEYHLVKDYEGAGPA